MRLFHDLSCEDPIARAMRQLRRGARRFTSAVSVVFSITVWALTPGVVRAFETPEPEDLSFYFVFIDRFENGDTSNDRANPRATFNATSGSAFHGGDLEGIRKRLPYIAGMGYNAMWITPFVENYNSYHGYGAFNWYNVDPEFGNEAKLKQLCDEARLFGIAMYFDMVCNHMSDRIHSTDSGYSGYRAPPNTYTLRWRSTNVAQQFPAPFNDLSLFHAHGGISNYDTYPETTLGELAGLDDLKTDDKRVEDLLVDVWSYWTTRTSVAGYRIDTVKHVDIPFWESFAPRIRTVAENAGKQNFFLFGELYGAGDTGSRGMSAYNGTLSDSSKPYKLDSCLDFQFYYNSDGVFARANSAPSNWASRLASRQSNLGVHHLKTPNFIDNHDVVRFLNSAKNNAGSGVDEQRRRLSVGLAAMLTAPGPPIVYYGTEQDFDGGSDPNNREDMFDGGFEQGPSQGNNFNTGSTRYQLIKQLNYLRSALEPLRRGSFVRRREATGGPGLLAFGRVYNNEEVLVVLNTSTSQVTQAAFATFLPAGTEVVDVLNPASPSRIISATDGFPEGTVPAQGMQVWVRKGLLPATPPDLSGITPADASANVFVDSPITISFNTAMEPVSTEAAVSILPETICTAAWNAEKTQLTLSPLSPLAYSTSYSVIVNRTAKSAGGIPIYSAGFAAFTTGAEPPPTATPSLTPSPSPTVSLTPTASLTPTPSLTPSPSPTESPIPTESPVPTISPTPSPSPVVSPTPSLPQSAGVLRPTALNITADGNGSEWASGAALGDNVALIATPANVYYWKDAVGDDVGTGTYLYPTNSAFTGGDADLAEVRVAYNPAVMYFYIRPAQVNASASFFTPYFGMAIDTADGGYEGSLGYNLTSNTRGPAALLVRADCSPEFELAFAGNGSQGARLIPFQGSVSSPTFGLTKSTGELEIAVTRASLGLSGPLANQRLRLVVYAGLETFGTMRVVGTTRAAYNPGGGSALGTNPNAFDLAGADLAEQTADMAAFDAGTNSTVYSSVLVLTLDERPPAQSDFWTLY